MSGRKRGEIERINKIAESKVIYETDPEKDKALIGLKLNLKQKKLIKVIGEEKPSTIADAGRLAGYKDGDDLTKTLYRDIHNPKLIEGIKLYYKIGDKGLGDLACGAISEIIGDKESSRDQKINASKLALQVAGKLKTVNYSVSASIPEDQIKDHIAKLLQG